MDAIIRNKFWVALGALVLISGVVFGVVFVPATGKNNQEMDVWVQQADEVRSYTQKDLRSPESVNKAKELKTAYEDDMGRVTAIFEQQDGLLDEPFVDPETGEVPEAARWKEIYGKKMDELAEEIGKSFAPESSSLVIRTVWGTEWPTPAQIDKAEKDYWLQKRIMGALASVNAVRKVVPTFARFNFLSAPDRLLHPSHGEIFEPIPFEVIIATDFQSIPDVLGKLMECEVPLYITALNVVRADEAGALLQVREGTGRQVAGPAPGRRGGGARGRGAPVSTEEAAMDQQMEMMAMFEEAAAARAMQEDQAARAIAAARSASGREAAMRRAGVAAAGPGGPSVRSGPGPRSALVAPGMPRRTPVRPRTGPIREEDAGERLVAVTIKGYVLDFVSPEKGEGQ